MERGLSGVLLPALRPAVRAGGVRLQRQPAGVPAGAQTPRHGLHLRRDQGARGAAHLQGPAVLRLPGCQGDGVPGLQTGESDERLPLEASR